MKVVGIITTSVAGLIALAGLAVGLRSIPDVRRYLHIRAM
jgi:hypothetical protein